MRTRIDVWVAAVAGALALSGCYADISDESVTFKRSLPVCDTGVSSCAFLGLPAALQGAIPLAVASGATEFTIDLGGDDFLKPESDVGPLKMSANLSLDGATLQMLTPSASFAGVDHLEIVQVPVAGCTGACQPRTVASYDRPAGGAADPAVISLAGRGANLLDMGGSRITIRVVASGTLPRVDWSADLTLRGKVSEHAAF